MTQEIASELSQLAARYPLPVGWQISETFYEQAQIAGLALELVGLIGEMDKGSGEPMSAFGSAAETVRPPTARAYYEMLERVYLLQAMATPQDWELLAADGRRLRTINHDQAFPGGQLDDSVRFRYAKSSGVALGQDFESACRSARMELLERDAVLRCWYGQIAPLSADDLARRFVHPELAELYEVQLYELPGDGYTAAVAVSFPRQPSAPLLIGHAAAEEREVAVRAAYDESIQRLGFLFGEEIPSIEPDFAMTPDYHQEFYLWPAKAAALRHWLSGAHQLKPNNTLRSAPEVSFIQLGAGPAGAPVAVKAISDECLPLVFGSGHPWFPDLPADLSVHPVS